MSLIDPKDAIIRFVEDMSLYDALTEDQTNVLHQWGEGQLRLRANRMTDPEAFEAWFGDLRGVLKMVNRYMGKRHELDAEKKHKYIEHLVDKAQTAGYPPTLAQVGPIINALEPLDDNAALRGLLNFVETASVAAPGMIDAPTPTSETDFSEPTDSAPEADFTEPTDSAPTSLEDVNEMTTEVMPLAAVREQIEAIRRQRQALTEAETTEIEPANDVEAADDETKTTDSDESSHKPNLFGRRPGLDDIPGADRK